MEMTRAVEDVLEEIGAGDSAAAARAQQGRPADEERRHELAFRHPDGLLVSGVTGEGLEELGAAIAESFERRSPTSSCSSRSRRARRCPSSTTWPVTSSARTPPRASA